MDVKQDANKIYESSMTRSKKINQLQNLILDSKNELDAQEQTYAQKLDIIYLKGYGLQQITCVNYKRACK